MKCKNIYSPIKIILLIGLFSLIIYAFHNNYLNTKLVEGNSRRCGKGKTWCSVKNKCVSIWQETCD